MSCRPANSLGHSPWFWLLDEKAGGIAERRMALLMLLFFPVTTVASQQLPLSPQQSIVEANRTLLVARWRPAPDQEPSPDERYWSGVTLKSLSSCSGTGEGFCRFDYQREGQTLSVVTVPSRPGQASVGRVVQWW